MLETGPDGGALTGVLQMLDAAHSGVAGVLGLDLLPSIIRAGVIHEDQLEGASGRGNCRQDLLRQETDVLRFIKNRDDDGKFRRHRQRA